MKRRTAPLQAAQIRGSGGRVSGHAEALCRKVRSANLQGVRRRTGSTGSESTVCAQTRLAFRSELPVGTGYSGKG
eukprot:6733368-Prymnesium_polylepis.1